MRGRQEAARGWGGSSTAPKILMEWLPSRKINSNPWSPGKGGEGCFPALALLSREAGSSPKESVALAQGKAAAKGSQLRPWEIPIPVPRGAPGEMKNKETRGEAPPAPSPSKMRLSQTAHTAATSRQRGQESSEFSSPWRPDSEEGASR